MSKAHEKYELKEEIDDLFVTKSQKTERRNNKNNQKITSNEKSIYTLTQRTEMKLGIFRI